MRHGSGHAVPKRPVARRSRLCARWCGGRSRPASTSWCPAGRPARARRSRAREHLRVVEITLEEAKGRVPGAGAARAATTPPRSSRWRAKCERLGADGILSVTPYYNKPTQEGLYQHYKAIASAIQLPLDRLQRAGPHRRERRAGHAQAAGRDRQHRRRQGSFRQHRPDGQHHPPGAAALHGALGRRRHHAAADRAGRPRHDLGGLERNSRRDDALAHAALANDFARRAQSIASTCR